MKIRTLIPALALVAALTASPAMAEESAATEGEDLRLGDEVDRICFARSINGWRTVDKLDNVVLLNRGVNNWYRVELHGTCRYLDMRSALAIGLDTRPAGSCISRGDIIVVESHGGFKNRCFVDRIYEWDKDAPASGEEVAHSEDGEDVSG